MLQIHIEPLVIVVYFALQEYLRQQYDTSNPIVHLSIRPNINSLAVLAGKKICIITTSLLDTLEEKSPFKLRTAPIDVKDNIIYLDLNNSKPPPWIIQK